MDIHKLLSSLTIEEKIGQLMQLAPFFFIEDIDVKVFGEVTALNLNKEKVFHSGSVLGINSAEQMIQIQKKYLKESRHKIPLVFMADIIHGYKTIFPVPIAMAASWNPDLAFQAAKIQAKESRVSGVQVTFSPMVDVSRDPRWGRVVEGFGEDPFLSSIFSKSIVQGYQGNDVKQEDQVACCVKHFAAYGASEAGRDYNTVDVSNYSLFNTYLPSYKAAVDAGVKLVMTSFNTIDSIPATVNRFLIKDVLRDKWGFDGVVISDYDSLHQVVAHGVAKDDKEAALRGLDAGLDIEMQSTCYTNHLKDLLDEKQIDEKQIDQAVYRILKLKEDLGLFEDPYRGAHPEKEAEIIFAKEHLDVAEKFAEESIVLLKNEDVLPLSKKLKYCILGPYAETIRTNGAWAGHGDNNLNTKLAEQLKDKHINVDFVKASLLPDYSQEELLSIKEADQIILALGENEYEAGEAHSKVDLHLPRGQQQFFDFAKSLNKKIIILLYHGRPFVLTPLIEADAILDVFYLGSKAHEAIANVLSGKTNPSGKLPMSYPRHGGQVPIYYNHLSTGRPHKRGVYGEYDSHYLDEENEALFPFGFGLSYANFEYANLTISKEQMYINDVIDISVDVKNVSQTPGFEIVEFYINDVHSYYARPVKELKGFKKVWINPQEIKTVTFQISKNDLSYYDPKGDTLFESGIFELMIGSSSEDVLSTSIEFFKGGKS